MTSKIKTEKLYHHNIYNHIRLVFGIAFVGTMSSFTHGFYLQFQPASSTNVTKLVENELETHSDNELDDSDCIADPRQIKSIKRAEEW